MIINRQIGDYVIESEFENVAPFFIRMAGAEDHMSRHENVTEAVKKIQLYQSTDKRRRK